MSSRYRFLVHPRLPAVRLGVRADRPFPSAAVEADWRDTRIRDEADVNDHVRVDVMRDGFSLFRM